MKESETTFQKVIREKRSGIVVEVWAFLMCNKKWWLLPIFLVLFLASALMVLGGSGAAPFIYSLF